jgi:hypothetical protein
VARAEAAVREDRVVEDKDADRPRLHVRLLVFLMDR